MQQTERAIKTKHDHTLTNYLKAGIFSLVMMAPLMSIGVRCGYVMLNKNAYQSYYGETINNKQYQSISNIKTDLEIGKTYHFDKSSFNNSFDANIGAYIYGINISNINIIYSSVDLTNFDTTTINKFSPYYNTTYGNRIDIQLINNDDTKVIGYTSEIIFDFVYEGNNLNNNWENSNIIFNINYNKYSYLDNAFDYSVNQLENETFISWTKNTGIYNAINTMTTGLDITNNALPVMLTYWSLMTAIYVIFDIIIGIFTKLTHLLQ